MKEEIELWRCGTRRIVGVTGSLFDEVGVEALVTHKPIGLAAFRFGLDAYMRRVGAHRTEGCVHHVSGGAGTVRYLIDGQNIEDDLTLCSQLEVRTVAMNGIRTDGYGERDNVVEIIRWWQLNPAAPLLEVRLIDLRGGFVRLGKLREEKKLVDSRGYSTDFER